MPIAVSGSNIVFADGSSIASGFTGFKNRIINGAMVIDQRNNGSSVSNPGSNIYIVDRWKINTTFTGTIGQNLGSVTPPAGFTNYFGMSVGAAGQSASNYGFIQHIEGFNTADLNWGTANAKTITVSFWVRSSLTGQFGFALQNEAGNRSYPVGYTINAANTWQQVTAIIPGDTSGTWIGATNGTGIQLYISQGALSARQGPSGAWASADYRSVTGAVDLITTNGATFYITGVQLEVGSTATSFDYRPYGTELALCQRYYAKFNSLNGNYVGLASGYCDTTTAGFIFVQYPVAMRTYPTLTQSNTQIYSTSGFPITSVGSGYFGGQSLAINMNTAGTMTVGRGCLILGNNSATAYIDLSAEL